MKRIENLLMCITAGIIAFCFAACEMPENSGKVETIYKKGDVKVETSLKAGEVKEDVDTISMEQNVQQENEKLGAGYFDVGIIPNDTTCPAFNSFITIRMDDEDSSNNNKTWDWHGAINNNGNTTFAFCRVDGLLFKPLVNDHRTDYYYAVLKLGFQCPPGSSEISRYFDNEDHTNTNDYLGEIAPNRVDANTKLYFCLFDNPEKSNDLMYEFPNLGIEYGVFANNRFPFAIEYGYLYIDDEDNNNANYWGDNPWYGHYYVNYYDIIKGYDNTEIRLDRVK